MPLQNDSSFSGQPGSQFADDFLFMDSMLRSRRVPSSSRNMRYFCHSCRRMFYTPSTSDEDTIENHCDRCGSTFVEEMTSRLLSPGGARTLDAQGIGITDHNDWSCQIHTLCLMTTTKILILLSFFHPLQMIRVDD